MPEVANIRLTGWKAAVVGLAVLGWIAWGFARHIQPVPTPACEALHEWLVADYTEPDVHHHFFGFGRGGTSLHGGVFLSKTPPITSPVDTADVSIEALDAHGWKDFLIARASLGVRGPGEPSLFAVRYLSLSQLPNGRWKVSGESSAWNYWWALVPAPRNGSSWP